MADIVLRTRQGEIMSGYKTSQFVWGSWEVTTPDGVLDADAQVADELTVQAYMYVENPDADRELFDLLGVRADIAQSMVIGSNGRPDFQAGESNTEVVLDEAMESAAPRVYYTETFTDGDIGAYIPYQDFNIGDVVTVHIGGKTVDAPITSIAFVGDAHTGEKWRITVGNDQFFNDNQARRDSYDVLQQAERDNRELMRRIENGEITINQLKHALVGKNEFPSHYTMSLTERIGDIERTTTTVYLGYENLNKDITTIKENYVGLEESVRQAEVVADNDRRLFFDNDIDVKKQRFKDAHNDYARLIAGGHIDNPRYLFTTDIPPGYIHTVDAVESHYIGESTEYTTTVTHNYYGGFVDATYALDGKTYPHSYELRDQYQAVLLDGAPTTGVADVQKTIAPTHTRQFFLRGIDWTTVHRMRATATGLLMLASVFYFKTQPTHNNQRRFRVVINNNVITTQDGFGSRMLSMAGLRYDPGIPDIYYAGSDDSAIAVSEGDVIEIQAQENGGHELDREILLSEAMGYIYT